MSLSGFKALSTICANFAAVFLGSMVVQIFVNGSGNSDLKMVVLGLIMTLGSVWLSILSAEKGKL